VSRINKKLSEKIEKARKEEKKKLSQRKLKNWDNFVFREDIIVRKCEKWIEVTHLSDNYKIDCKTWKYFFETQKLQDSEGKSIDCHIDKFLESILK
jgi:hypothetical protein